jgi:hypothetical protein
MSLTFDPEIAAALAPMAESGFTPPAVGDMTGRRAMWEPIIGAASTAQPIPADVTTSEHHATAEDGAQIKMRWLRQGPRDAWLGRAVLPRRRASASHLIGGTPGSAFSSGRLR